MCVYIYIYNVCVCVCIIGGFWHSAFFGRTPSAFFHYNWFLKMLEDEQAEIHRANSLRAAPNAPQESSSSSSSSSAHPSSSSAQPDFSGAAAGAQGAGGAGAVRSGEGAGREGGGGVGRGEEKVTAARMAVGDRVVVEEDSVVVEEEGMSIGAAAEVEGIELAWLKALREMSDRRQGQAGWRAKSGRYLDEYVRDAGVFRLKMTNKSTQARKVNESAGYVALRHDQDPRVAKSLNFNIWYSQKRPITVSKDAYYMYSASPSLSTSTSGTVKRDLLQCQKTPITCTARRQVSQLQHLVRTPNVPNDKRWRLLMDFHIYVCVCVCVCVCVYVYVYIYIYIYIGGHTQCPQTTSDGACSWTSNASITFPALSL